MILNPTRNLNKYPNPRQNFRKNLKLILFLNMKQVSS
jgi:hypothetical protein